MIHIRLKDHIKRKRSIKSVCVTAVLTGLGIPLEAFHSTSTTRNVHAYENVIRRHGFALRSRKSSMPKNPTVSRCREAIKKLNDPEGTLYAAVLHYGTSAHLILIDEEGNTVIDTDSRAVDRRRVGKISAVWKR